MGIFSRIAHTIAGGDFRMSIREPREVMAEDEFIPALVEASNRSERVIVVEGTVKYQLLRSRRKKDSEGREGWSSIPSQTTEGMVVVSPQPMTMQPGDTITFISNNARWGRHADGRFSTGGDPRLHAQSARSCRQG